MRKRSIPGSTWTTRSGSRHSRMQPASVSDRPSRRSASRNKTRPPSDEISPPPKSAVTFLRLTAGRSNGSRLSSVMAAWRFRCLGRRTLDNDFLPNTNDLRHVRHHIVAPQRIKRAKRLTARSAFVQSRSSASESAGWKIEREQGIFGHGGRGAFVAWEEREHLATNFYPMTTTYAMSAITTSGRAE